jgi:NADP-dependent 3-hydroxy acid dehydrogenase YdfG
MATLIKAMGVPTHVLITGASSGVGAATARRLASQTLPHHSLTLYLCGRNKDNLREVRVQANGRLRR